MTAPERFGEWAGATFVSSDPTGPVQTGQVIQLRARGFGRAWPVTIEVRDLDPLHQWIDLLVRLPLGIENHEHVTLTETPEKGTLVRFN